MATAITGLNAGVAARLAGRSPNIVVVAPSTAKRGELRLVLGPAHAESVLTARDGASRSIMLGSHKLGHNARTLALLPAAAAAKGGNVSVRMFYDQIADGFAQDAAAGLIDEYGAKGVHVLTGATPAMQAKLLAWDDDSLFITSQNMLSANPSDPYAEIGVMIVAPDAAARFRERMEPLLPSGGSGLPRS